MASSLKFVEFVADQIEGAGGVTYRMMFGEYGFHCDGKFVAMVSDDRFFVKPTEAGLKFIKDPVEAPPYPGAKNYFLIEEQLENREWMSRLIRVTADALPVPKKKKKKGYD